MATVLKTAPTVEPVTTAEAKTHLRVDGLDQDTYIDTLIQAARMYLEEITSRSFVSQTWTLHLDYFPTNGIKMPKAPLISVTSVKYTDTDGVQQTLVDGTDYTVDIKGDPGWIMPEATSGWPSTDTVANAVEVEFVAGYADQGNSPVDLADNIPQPIKHAMLLLIGDWFSNREDVITSNMNVQLPRGVDALIAPYRLVSF